MTARSRKGNRTMARKKRRPKSNRPPRRAGAPDVLPDPRASEAVMSSFIAGLHGGAAPDTPLARAQGVMYRAFEQRNPAEQVRLAREALALSQDCADAYVVLAEHAPTRKQALDLFEKGVHAGE